MLNADKETLHGKREVNQGKKLHVFSLLYKA